MLAQKKNPFFPTASIVPSSVAGDHGRARRRPCAPGWRHPLPPRARLRSSPRAQATRPGRRRPRAHSPASSPRVACSPRRGRPPRPPPPLRVLVGAPASIISSSVVPSSVAGDHGRARRCLCALADVVSSSVVPSSVAEGPPNRRLPASSRTAASSWRGGAVGERRGAPARPAHRHIPAHPHIL
jgi:hypothetical protein